MAVHEVDSANTGKSTFIHSGNPCLSHHLGQVWLKSIFKDSTASSRRAQVVRECGIMERWHTEDTIGNCRKCFFFFWPHDSSLILVSRSHWTSMSRWMISYTMPRTKISLFFIPTTYLWFSIMWCNEFDATATRRVRFSNPTKANIAPAPLSSSYVHGATYASNFISFHCLSFVQSGVQLIGRGSISMDVFAWQLLFWTLCPSFWKFPNLPISIVCSSDTLTIEPDSTHYLLPERTVMVPLCTSLQRHGKCILNSSLRYVSWLNMAGWVGSGLLFEAQL